MLSPIATTVFNFICQNLYILASHLETISKKPKTTLLEMQVDAHQNNSFKTIVFFLLNSNLEIRNFFQLNFHADDFPGGKI